MLFDTGLAVCVDFATFNVPNIAKQNGTVRFDCIYNLEPGEVFYSVKWYKNDIPFYQRIPQHFPEVTVWDVNGTHVNVRTK